MNKKKAEKLFEAMTDLDQEMILSAAPAQTPPLHRSFRWQPYLSAAACFALVVLAGVAFARTDGLTAGGSSAAPAAPAASAPASFLEDSAKVESAPAKTPAGTENQPAALGGLPLLKINDAEDSAFGFEGYMVYNESDLVTANPWTAENSAQLTTLPVYSNLVLAGQPDWETMETILTQAAGALSPGTTAQISNNGPTPEDLEKILAKYRDAGMQPDWASLEPSALVAQVDGASLEVDSSLTLTIENQPSLPLPQTCNWGHYAPYPDSLAAGEYLLEEYSVLLDMETPTLAVEGGDRNIYGQQSYRIKIYDGAGSLTDRILSYNFTFASFACDEEGGLWLTRLYRPDLSRKLGDYPILTLEEAKQSLLDGYYVTNAPEPFAGPDSLRGAELVYKTGRHLANWVPYYRFYAEVPGWEYTPEGQKTAMPTYGAYYVPAVRPEYISDMELWTGSFN